MNEFDKAQAKHAKNKVRSDAYAQKLKEAEEDIRELKKSSVKRCTVTLIINDGSEHSQTWEANQLFGTVIAGQRKKEWYMSTAKSALEKFFGRLTCP